MLVASTFGPRPPGRSSPKIVQRVRKHLREEGWELPDENALQDDDYSCTIPDARQVAPQSARGRRGPSRTSWGAPTFTSK
jgi:hypothetical protein